MGVGVGTRGLRARPQEEGCGCGAHGEGRMAGEAIHRGPGFGNCGGVLRREKKDAML